MAWRMAGGTAWPVLRMLTDRGTPNILLSETGGGESVRKVGKRENHHVKMFVNGEIQKLQGYSWTCVCVLENTVIHRSVGGINDA